MPQATAEVRDFIAHALAKGAQPEEIRIALLKKGWPDDIIETAFHAEKGASKSIVQIQNLTKSFDRNIVLNCINLDIYEGEIFALIGVSGCGKTTLLNTIVGFAEPDEGSVRLNMDVSSIVTTDLLFRNPHGIKKVFGFSTQTGSFYENLTVDENLEYFASLYGLSPATISRSRESLLKLLGLTTCSDQLAGTLSKGMQKRLDIACALIHDPKILILDEPVANLDPFLRKEIWSLIKEINKQGKTVIIASHFLSELEEFCTRIGVLYNHGIVAVGTPLELKKYYTQNYEVIFQTKSHRYPVLLNRLKQQRGLHIARVHTENNRVTLYTPEPQETLRVLLHLMSQSKEELVDIDVNRPTVREIFETMVKKNE
ncbi:ATP-binding cassette domain-containing protein [Candidatus Woesearchaeota archaeon]|nr:ATP-binding cassette domain-containing protein [Candidatus Woesearchaeota archaeon]